MSPYLHKPAIVIVTSHAPSAGSPRSHYDVILIVMSFATELTTPSITGVLRMDTLPRLIYKDVADPHMAYSLLKRGVCCVIIVKHRQNLI